MKKVKCSICNTKRAKRECSIKDTMICPLCCAKIRNESECSECIHFQNAREYNTFKEIGNDYIAFEENKEIEDAVDKLLSALEQGEHQESKNKLTQLYTEHPENNMANFGMGVYYAITSQPESAIPYFKKAIETAPLFLEAYYNLGMAYIKTFDVKNAYFTLMKVRELGDPHEDYTQKSIKTLDDIKTMIAIDYNVSLKQFFKGQEIFEKAFKNLSEKKSKLAIKGFLKMLNIIPNHIQSWGNIGIAYIQLGNKDKALRALNIALSLDPDYEPAIINKKSLESIKEGETIDLNNENLIAVDYFKDIFS